MNILSIAEQYSLEYPTFHKIKRGEHAGKLALPWISLRTYAYERFEIMPKVLREEAKALKLEFLPVLFPGADGKPGRVQHCILIPDPTAALTAAAPQLLVAMREREMTVDDVLKLVREAEHPVTGKLPGEEWV